MHCLQQIHAYSKRFHLTNFDHARSIPGTPTRISSRALLISQTCTPSTPVCTPLCTPHSPMETPNLPEIARETWLSHSPNDDELLKGLELTFVDGDDAGEEHFTSAKKEQDSRRADAQITRLQLQQNIKTSVITSYPDTHHPHPHTCANPPLNQRDSLILSESNATY